MHKVAKEIEINAPVAEVFALFSRFDHFSRWMKGIKSVEWSTPKRTRWTAEAPDGARLEWEAEVTELEPGRHVAWHSIGGDVEAEGEARFIPTPQDTTLLQLSLGYALPQGQSEATSAAAFVANLDQRASEDLIWFRLYAEREAQGGAAPDEAPVPAAAATALPAAQPDVEESAVHFDSFSGMLRTGQPIRPARPITTPFDENAEATIVRPPNNRFTPAAPARRSLLPYALLGLLLIVAIGLFAMTRRRANVAEQPLVAPTASPQMSSSSKSSGQPAPSQVAKTEAPSTAPTLAPEVRQLPAATLEPRAAATEDVTLPENRVADEATRAGINATINGWLAATNDKNVDAQISFYAPVLQRYYLQNNYSRTAVRAERARRFAQADSVRMNASDPEISLEQNGRTARVRFRKDYEIAGSTGTQSGAVLQELVLVNNGDGWRIVSERDLRVLR